MKKHTKKKTKKNLHLNDRKEFCIYLEKRLGIKLPKTYHEETTFIIRMVAQISENEFIKNQLQQLIKDFQKRKRSKETFCDFLRSKLHKKIKGSCDQKKILGLWVDQTRHNFKFNDNMAKKLYKDYLKKK